MSWAWEKQSEKRVSEKEKREKERERERDRAMVGLVKGVNCGLMGRVGIGLLQRTTGRQTAKQHCCTSVC